MNSIHPTTGAVAAEPSAMAFEIVDWSATQRVERLKPFVQNRRFLLLTEKGLDERIITADPLHCQKANARAIVE